MNKNTKGEYFNTKHTNEYKCNVKYFKSLLKWEKLVKQVLILIADHQRRKQNANTRKDLIIAKLAIEFFRPSPFELTDNLVRTKEKWEKLNLKAKERNENLLERQQSVPDNLLLEIKHEQESEDNEFVNIKARLACRCQSGLWPPDNSKESTLIEEASSNKNKSTSTVTSPKSSKVDRIEIASSVIYIPKPTAMVTAPKNSPVDIPENSNSESDTHKPAYIVTNDHKLISADSKIKMNFPPALPLPIITRTVTEEWFSFIPSVSVFSSPPKLSIIDDHLIDQTIKFTVTNGSNKYVHLKYIDVTDRTYFSYAKVDPKHSHKVYPGMSVTFKLSFKLKMRKMVFTSTLFFRVSCNRTYDRPPEGFNVPIISEYLKTRAVDISEIVHIPPMYPWHLNRSKKNLCSGIIEMSINDGYSYHLHINKHPEDFSQADEEVSVTNSTSQFRLPSLTAESSKKLEINDMAMIIDSLVERALDPFFIVKSYMRVRTSSQKYKIPVYLHTIEHIGCHNCYYDFTFFDDYTDEFIFTKTIRIFADILPSPVEISPPMLDMSSVPVNRSFGESIFCITNNHKLFPVRIKIILTRKMKRVFSVIPMETVIPTTTTVKYQIKFSTLDKIPSADKMVYFAFEIAMFGPKFIYKGMPHTYYEVVAPCFEYYNKITHNVDELLKDLDTS